MQTTPQWVRPSNKIYDPSDKVRPQTKSAAPQTKVSQTKVRPLRRRYDPSDGGTTPQTGILTLRGGAALQKKVRHLRQVIPQKWRNDPQTVRTSSVGTTSDRYDISNWRNISDRYDIFRTKVQPERGTTRSRRPHRRQLVLPTITISHRAGHYYTSGSSHHLERKRFGVTSVKSALQK
ncbi:hypothetical protein AVEN_204875-1 [Araneus ventricosus]|uniref:Uncharacterized protein n=1 Tax=Araneus ventricosus TaxID=182803 RepID=A0A4Y2UJR6_ARAVE|nr:hypothetical protein AVEN_204875-1 [Araneus ventricosus]